MAYILIIDDEPEIREVLTEVLKRAGHRVDTAGTGDEGIRRMKSRVPDIVITDIIMPGKDGVATIREIRESFPGIGIIAISGGGNFGSGTYEPDAIKTTAYLAAAEEAGANTVLSKPFGRRELVEAVASLIEG